MYYSSSLVERVFDHLGGFLLTILLCLSFTLPSAADEATSLPIGACGDTGDCEFGWSQGSDAALAQTEAQPLDAASFEAEVISLVNQERARYGLYALVPNYALTMAARGHSRDMADNEFFNHVGSDGSGFVERIQRAGYTGICAAGENIAAGQTSPAAVVSAWMSSSGHRANILSSKFRDIGVGYVYEADDVYPGGYYGYMHYWTQEFGVHDCLAPTPTVGLVPPTATWTPTRIPTLAWTATRTATWTPQLMVTWTPTHTFTHTPVPSATPTRTFTPIPTRTPTNTFTPTHTLTPTPTHTNTPRPTLIVSAPTPTFTSTPPDLSAALVGVVELQGRVGKPGTGWVVPLMVTLRRQDGDDYVTRSLYTTPLGEFIVQDLPPGVYSVRVKNPLTLANVKSQVALAPGMNRVNLGTLLAGDSSNDNVVDVLDFSLLRSTFGTRAKQADFNGDGVVDVLDFSLLRAHFGLSGDIPIK